MKYLLAIDVSGVIFHRDLSHTWDLRSAFKHRGHYIYMRPGILHFLTEMPNHNFQIHFFSTMTRANVTSLLSLLLPSHVNFPIHCNQRPGHPFPSVKAWHTFSHMVETATRPLGFGFRNTILVGDENHAGDMPPNAVSLSGIKEATVRKGQMGELRGLMYCLRKIEAWGGREGVQEGLRRYKVEKEREELEKMKRMSVGSDAGEGAVSAGNDVRVMPRRELEWEERSSADVMELTMWNEM